MLLSPLLQKGLAQLRRGPQLQWLRLRSTASILLKNERARRSPEWLEALSKLPFTPNRAILNVTDNCNSRCVTCNVWQERSTHELTQEEWAETITQLHAVGCSTLILSGGEPLLRKDLEQLIRLARQLGMHVGLNTNGGLLTEQRLKQLLEAGLSSVSLSMDAVGQDYRRIRGMAFEKALRAARLLATAHRQKQLQVALSCTLSRLTLPHVWEVLALSRGLELPLGFNLVDSTPYVFRGVGNESNAWIEGAELEKLDRLVEQLLTYKKQAPEALLDSRAALEYISHYFRDPLQKALPCTVALLRICIDAHGQVFGGCWSMGAFGSLREQSLLNILASPAYVEKHKQMFKKECPGCSCGYKVNLRYSLPSLLTPSSGLEALV